MTKNEEKAMKWIERVKDDALATLDQIKNKPNIRSTILSAGKKLFTDRKGIAETLIRGFKELERYRAIGTVEECRSAMEKQEYTTSLLYKARSECQKRCDRACKQEKQAREFLADEPDRRERSEEMSREHLCRAKKKNWRELPKSEQWVYGYYAEIGGESVIIKQEWHYAYSAGASPQQGKANDIVEIDQDTVCECTGLSDANGRRFEGDIFQADNGDCVQIYIIVWDEKCLEWYAECIGDPDGSLPLCEFRVDEIEVIGNILDTPELLGNQAAKEVNG